MCVGLAAPGARHLECAGGCSVAAHTPVTSESQPHDPPRGERACPAEASPEPRASELLATIGCHANVSLVVGISFRL